MRLRPSWGSLGGLFLPACCSGLGCQHPHYPWASGRGRPLYPPGAGACRCLGVLTAGKGVETISPGAFSTCSCLRHLSPTATPTCECAVAEKPRDAARGACRRDLGCRGPGSGLSRRAACACCAPAGPAGGGGPAPRDPQQGPVIYTEDKLPAGLLSLFLSFFPLLAQYLKAKMINF